MLVVVEVNGASRKFIKLAFTMLVSYAYTTCESILIAPLVLKLTQIASHLDDVQDEVEEDVEKKKDALKRPDGKNIITFFLLSVSVIEIQGASGGSTVSKDEISFDDKLLACNLLPSLCNVPNLQDSQMERWIFMNKLLD